jgi:hypothetical protein
VLPAVVTVLGICVILIAQLMLSIAVADGAYQIADLQETQRDLQRQEQALTENLEVLSSTQNLTANAEHLGMIASGNPVFLDLSTGGVSGNPTAAGGTLTGTSGNQIGNSLLSSSTLVDRAPATGGVSKSSFKPTPVSSVATDADDSAGSDHSDGPVESSPGTIPSPNTH